MKICTHSYEILTRTLELVLILMCIFNNSHLQLLEFKWFYFWFTTYIYISFRIHHKLFIDLLHRDDWFLLIDAFSSASGPRRPRPPVKPSGYTVAVATVLLEHWCYCAFDCVLVFSRYRFMSSFSATVLNYMLFHKTFVNEFCAWCAVGTRELV